MAISKEAKPLECRGSDIIAGPSGREVISLQKVDSLLAFQCTEKLKSFLLCSGPRGFRQKNLQNLDSMQLEGRFDEIRSPHVKRFECYPY